MPTLGILGTMVWDRIWYADPAQTEPVEEWGGICYALEAFEALGPSDWRARPIVKVGRDLYERAGVFLGRLPSVDSTQGVREVPAPNFRVELRYTSGARRCERLTGGLPPWTFDELEPLLAGLDALYINFITGNEMRLDTLHAVRRAFPGPIYGDVHSLMLATGPAGERTPAPLPRARDWVRAFDVAQMNEDELGMMAKGWGDPWRFAADVVGRDTRVLFVTLGPRGAAYFVGPLFRSVWEPGGALEIPGAVRSAKVPVPAVEEGDPTGCGDVWGIASFVGLLEGRSVEEAVARANAAAGLNVRHRGASGLHHFLRGRIETLAG